MVDRIDIGMGPRLGFDPTDTGGFKYVGQKELTQEEYGSRKVNFYNEYLGLPSLGEESDIEVGAPEVGEDIKPEERDSTDESEAVTNVLRDPTFTDGEATTGAGSIKYGAEAYKPFTSEYATYSEYLRGAGKMDRVNLVSGIYEPLTKGNYRDIDLSVLGVEAREGVQAVRDAPQTLSEEFAELREEGFAGVKKRVAAGVPKAMAGVFAMAGLGTVGSLLTGDTVKNAFGAASFRPSGPLGVVSDLVHAKQYEDLAQIRAAESAASVFGPGDTFTYSDTGFAMQFGNGMGITRRPGARGYTGNLQGMTVSQIKDLEALTKGFIPNSYRFSGKAGLTDFGDFKANVSVEESGGVFTDPNNRLKGFYTADGKYYTPGVGYSRYGNAADRNRLAKSEFGWTTKAERERMQDIIEAARAGKGTLADLIQAEKDKIAADRAEQRRQEQEKERQRKEDEYRSQYGGGRGYGAGAGLAEDSGDSDSGNVESIGTGGGLGGGYSGTDYGGIFAQGGTVGMAAGGAMAAGMGSGFVDRPPSQVPEEQTVADDVETQMPEGAFVINAAAVEFAGEQDIKKMLNDAQKEAVRRGITIDNSENSTKLIDVAISRGEVTVAPYLAKIIGYDRLNKINNRGKPETKERLQEAAQGGMLGMAEGGVASPTRRPKREQLADIELRADLETFIQGDALARLGYKLYEQGDVRFNTVVAPREYGVRPRFKGAYFPPGNVRTDKRGVIPIRDIDDMRTGRVMEAQGIAPSQLESDAGRVLLVGSMFDTSETTIDMITIAHEFRHAALDYLSKTYDLGLPTLKQEERIMDYADNQAIEKAGKVNPKLKERYFSNPDYKLMSERGKSAGDSGYLRKQYEQYTGLAEEILEAMDVPPQSPAIEKEGFLTRTYKSLVN